MGSGVLLSRTGGADSSMPAIWLILQVVFLCEGPVHGWKTLYEHLNNKTTICSVELQYFLQEEYYRIVIVKVGAEKVSKLRESTCMLVCKGFGRTLFNWRSRAFSSLVLLCRTH